MTPTAEWYEADADDSDRSITDDVTANTHETARAATETGETGARVHGDADLLRKRTAALDRVAAENERLRAEVERLTEDVAEYGGILSRQADLLTRTVNALKGDPPDLTSWSHHDVPELAQSTVDRRDWALSEHQRVITLYRAALQHAQRSDAEVERLTSEATEREYTLSLAWQAIRSEESGREAAEAKLRDVEALADEWRNRPHPEGAESVQDWVYRTHVKSLGSILRAVLARSQEKCRKCDGTGNSRDDLDAPDGECAECKGSGSLARSQAPQAPAEREGSFECKTFLPQNPDVAHVDRERCHVDRPHRSHEHTKGLFAKYHVERIYDPNGKHADCRYFVLDPQHDPIARVALRAYADAAKGQGLDTLSADLRGWLINTAPSVRPATTDGEG